jgi:hypothetical protein
MSDPVLTVIATGFALFFVGGFVIDSGLIQKFQRSRFARWLALTAAIKTRRLLSIRRRHVDP